MHLHVIGISGTFMSALALFARKLGFTVTGSDVNCYPPVSDFLKAEGIEWTEGYDDCHDALKADCVIVGNTGTRGIPVVEAVLESGKPYVSGPEWLAKEVLSKYRVLAVAGTHGKTTTASMLAFILDCAGLEPGFLIGGITSNFKTNARLGAGEWFVIEADEYDSAFFDKRPKFMHYRPECAVLNNLEFDHADIYADLAEIQKQVHYFLKTIPPQGELLYPLHDSAVQEVLEKGVYSHASSMAVGADAKGAVWRAELKEPAGRSFEVFHNDKLICDVNWSVMGEMNVQNALSALASSVYAGVEPVVAARALEQFKPTKRRLEMRLDANHIKVYDDFAHHPTAMEKTLQAVKASGEHQRVWVILTFGSHSMRMGVHGRRIFDALQLADGVLVFAETPLPDEVKLTFDVDAWPVYDSGEVLAESLSSQVQPGDAIIVMSNKSSESVHQALIASLL